MNKQAVMRAVQRVNTISPLAVRRRTSVGNTAYESWVAFAVFSAQLITRRQTLNLAPRQGRDSQYQK
jgi:hypothetical protein